MTDGPVLDGPEGPDGPAGAPALDLVAVLSGIQDQLDDLTAAVEAQQETITLLRQALERHIDETEPPSTT